MDGDADDGRPNDQLRARAAESRTKLWLYLEADRRLVVAGLVAAVFVALLVVGLLLPDAATKLRGTDAVETLFQGFLTATITGVTLVLTLNQLVLSQELGAVGDQRERMVGALEFREDAADLIEAPVSPARPSQFLRGLVQMAGRHAHDLRDAVAEEHSAHGAVDDLTESLIGNAEAVTDGLDGAQFGEFDVLSAALNFNYSWKIFAAQRIRETETLDDDAEAALDSLVDTLELFGPAREHCQDALLPVGTHQPVAGHPRGGAARPPRRRRDGRLLRSDRPRQPGARCRPRDRRRVDGVGPPLSRLAGLRPADRDGDETHPVDRALHPARDGAGGGSRVGRRRVPLAFSHRPCKPAQ
jgi:hypothetical protein